MLVNWTKLGLKTIPLLNETGQVTETIFIQPGWNHLKNVQWEQAIRNESIAKQVESGVIELQADKIEIVEEERTFEDDKGKSKKRKVKTVQTEGKDFSDLGAEEALKVIEDCYNLDTLASWRKVESRDELRAAIANRIEKIETAGE